MVPTAEQIARRLQRSAEEEDWPPRLRAAAARVAAALLMRELPVADAELQALDERSDSYEVAIAHAVVEHLRGRYREAARHARRAANLRPLALEPWLVGFRAAMAARDHVESSQWLAALEQIAPRDHQTLRAKAALAWETGELGTLRGALRDLPDEAVYASPADADLRRLARMASVVVGDGRVSVLMGIFEGAGLRAAHLGWRDPHSALPPPTMARRWRALSGQAKEGLALEEVRSEGTVCMLGLRVNGMNEDRPGEALRLLGMLEITWSFEGIEGWSDRTYGALLIVDHTNRLIQQPRRIWAHEIRGIADDDWLALPRASGPGGRRPADRAESTPDAPRAPRVFVSYAREDAAMVSWLYQRLRDHGIEPWRDQEELRVGHHWESEIAEAIERADFVVFCLSTTSVSKRGFVQAELRRVLREAELRPMGAIYILPVRLDEVEVPRQLAPYHAIDLFPDRSTSAEDVATAIWRHWQRQGPR